MTNIKEPESNNTPATEEDETLRDKFIVNGVIAVLGIVAVAGVVVLFFGVSTIGLLVGHFFENVVGGTEGHWLGMIILVVVVVLVFTYIDYKSGNH